MIDASAPSFEATAPGVKPRETAQTTQITFVSAPSRVRAAKEVLARHASGHARDKHSFVLSNH